MSPLPDLGVLLQGYGDSRELSGFTGFAGVEDSLWPSTGSIDTETASLEITVQQMGNDIFADTVSASNDGYQTFLTAWDAFVADFDQWRASSYFWNPTRRDELVSYRAKFNALLAQYHTFNTAGATVGGVQPVAGASTPDFFRDNMGKFVTAGMIVGVIILAPILVPSLKSAFSALHAVKNPRRRRRRRR